MINLIEQSEIESTADGQQPDKHPTSPFKQEIMKRMYLFHPYVLHPLLMVVLAGGLFSQCQREEGSGSKHPEYVVSVKNESDNDYSDCLIEITKSDLSADEYEPGLEPLIVMDGEEEIASQWSDDRLYILIEYLKPGEEKQLHIIKGRSSAKQEKRTQAELSVKTGGHFENRKYINGKFENIQYLRVPDEHTDHSFYIRYEGPGWESDLVGYRFYLDWRNATDVFGKKTHQMVLQHIGLDGFDSYHKMQDWGVDVLKVGNSLGIGSLAMYDGKRAVRIDRTDSVFCAIAENGTIYSAVKTEYYGWNVGGDVYDVSSKISIHAGTRLSHHEVRITNQPENLCTGIGKDSNAKLYAEQGSDDRWGYLASYGLQSLNNDHLGLAVFFAHQDYKGFTEDEFSHIVKLKVGEGKANYYFLAAWEGELDGVKSEDEFLVYVNKTARKLAKPLTVNIQK
jgi:hypothetical protein